jgi:hypothetical protein
LWEKGFNAKDIHKEIFPVYVGFSVGGKRFADEDVGNGGAEVVETTGKKDFYAAGFEALGKLYECQWRICREINVSFLRLEYHMFKVLFHL